MEDQAHDENRTDVDFAQFELIKNVLTEHAERSSTQLHDAIRRRRFDYVKMLVEHRGADVNAKTKYGLTPLHFAAKYASENEDEDDDQVEREDEFIAYLIEYGAILDEQDQNGMTALHYAAGRGHVQAARQLMRAGAQFEIPDNEGMTPFMLAVKSGEMEMISFLIDSEVDYTCLDRKGNSALHFVAQVETPGLIELLYTKLEELMDPDQLKEMLNHCNEKDETPLHWSVRSMGMTPCRFLIDKGADIFVKTAKNETALHLAAREGYFATIALLLDQGAEINSEDATLQTPLFKAIQSGVCEAVKVLLERGATVNCFDKLHQTPLIMAAKLGKADICAELLRNEADIFALDSNWNNALFQALMEKHLPVVQTLVESENGRALLDTEDSDQNTVIHIAVRSGSLKTTDYLINQGVGLWGVNAFDQTAFHVAAIHGRYRIMLRLLEQSPSVAYESDEDGNLPIHLAAKHGFPQIVKILLEQPHVLNEKNDFGWTPLMCAAETNKVDCVKVLLDQGAEVDSMDKSEVTALFLACQEGFPAVVKQLLERGANPSHRVSATHVLYPGWNALDVAVHKRNLDCVRLIVNDRQWATALLNVVVTDGGKVINPFRRMIAQLPEAADLVLTRFVETSNGPEKSEDYAIKFNFEILNDKEMLQQHEVRERTRKISRRAAAAAAAHLESTENEAMEPMLNQTDGSNRRSAVKRALCNYRRSKIKSPIEFMVKKGREELLHHPLIVALLSYKWARMHILYYVHLGTYILFLALFTTFMLLTEPPYMIKNETMHTSKLACLALEEANTKAYRHYVMIPKYGAMILGLISLLIELLQFIRDRLNYFNLENCFEVTIFVLTVLTTVDTSWCMMRTGLREDWQWACGTIGLFLAWINLLLFVRLGPIFGIFVIMFVSVTITFAKFFCVFSPVLIAFALSFHTLLANQHAFRNMPNALLKTFGMTIGELDIGDHVFERFSSTEQDDQVYHEFLTHVLLISFMTLMCIVIMNLLVGLAVDDIKEVQRKAALKRQEMKIELILHTEAMLSKFGLFSQMPSQYVYHPNRRKSIMEDLFHKAYTQYKKIPEDFEVTAKDETVDVQDVEKKMKTVQMQIKAIAKLLTQVVQHLKVCSEPRPLMAPLDASQSEVQMDDIGLDGTGQRPKLERLNIDDDMDVEPFHFRG